MTLWIALNFVVNFVVNFLLCELERLLWMSNRHCLFSENLGICGLCCKFMWNLKREHRDHCLSVLFHPITSLFWNSESDCARLSILEQFNLCRFSASLMRCIPFVVWFIPLASLNFMGHMSHNLRLINYGHSIWMTQIQCCNNTVVPFMELTKFLRQFTQLLRADQVALTKFLGVAWTKPLVELIEF